MQWTRRGKLLAAFAGAAAAGAAWVYLRERKPWTPPFDPIEQDGAIELRSYPAIAIAETVRPGARDRALGDGYDRLSEWLRAFPDLAQTMPVLATRAQRGWRVRFPLAPDSVVKAADGVAIGALPPRRIAAIRFAGKADDRLLATKERELHDWLAGRGIPAGAAEHAFYNSPALPGAARRTEVWLPLE